MPDTVKAGTVLIKEGATLPEALSFESESCLPGWKAVKYLDGYALDRKVREAGWTFFLLAGEISAIAFGTDERSTVPRAIKRILANPSEKQFNSLEITSVTPKHFLWLPYTRVGAQPRHVQEDLVLFSAARAPQSGGTRVGVTQAKARVPGNAAPLVAERTGERVAVAAAPGM